MTPAKLLRVLTVARSLGLKVMSREPVAILASTEATPGTAARRDVSLSARASLCSICWRRKRMRPGIACFTVTPEYAEPGCGLPEMPEAEAAEGTAGCSWEAGGREGVFCRPLFLADFFRGAAFCLFGPAP